MAMSYRLKVWPEDFATVKSKSPEAPESSEAQQPVRCFFIRQPLLAEFLLRVFVPSCEPKSRGRNPLILTGDSSENQSPAKQMYLIVR